MIRPARSGDVESLIELIHGLAAYERAPEQVEATPDHLREALFGPDPRAFAHVAEHADGDRSEIAGFALWFLNFSTWTGRQGIYLEDLFVKPEYRRHGYGSALLVELARICVERGYARLEWAVLDWNQPAIEFYRRIGASPQDEWTVFRLHGEALRRLGS